jgi:hypothetical protein
MFEHKYQGKASYDKALVENAFKGKACKVNTSKSNA